jgi:hypothetical protein
MDGWCRVQAIKEGGRSVAVSCQSTVLLYGTVKVSSVGAILS